MKYWLLKSEPNVWSIDQQKRAGARGTNWDGVRNYQASNNLKKMKKGDLCFFYHSNIFLLISINFPLKFKLLI